jgi:carbon storage regulator
MLVLSRQKDESIMVGDEVEVVICDIRGDRVRLGIRAPRNFAIHRREIWDKIQEEGIDRKNPYKVDCTHTDKGQIATALALKYRQRARAAEEALKEAEFVINKFSGWYYNDGDECPMTQHKFCPNIAERKESHSKRMVDELEADRWEFDPAAECCECDYIHIAAGCFAEHYRKQYRDKQLEDILGKPQQFFPQCIHREMKGNVAMCYDPENARHNKPCSKRCETPTKGESE